MVKTDFEVGGKGILTDIPKYMQIVCTCRSHTQNLCRVLHVINNVKRVGENFIIIGIQFDRLTPEKTNDLPELIFMRREKSDFCYSMSTASLGFTWVMQ